VTFIEGGSLHSFKKYGTHTMIPPVPGPMANSVDCCERMMRAWCREARSGAPSMYDLDAAVPPLGWKAPETDLAGKRLRVGVVRTDGFFHPGAAQRRALQETVDALQAAGHTLIEVTTKDTFELNGWAAYAVVLGVMGGAGNMHDLIQVLEGEELLEAYTTLYRSANLPNWLRFGGLLWLLKRLGHPRLAFMASHSRNGGHSVRTLFSYYSDLQHEMRCAWNTKVFEEHTLDCVLCPGLPPAFPHGAARDLFPSCSAVFLMNALGFPTGCLPVTTVREDECFYDEEPRDGISRKLHAAMRGAAGLPVGVQVMGREWRDELTLGCMREVERCLQAAGTTR